MFDDPYLRGKWFAIIIWMVMIGGASLSSILPH